MSVDSDDAPVAVIGAGTMGHGLAVQFARHGRSVALVDHRDSNLATAREQIADAVAFLLEEGLIDIEPDTILDRIEFTLDLEAGVADAEFVLETVSEELAVKHTVFEHIANAAPADSILASNTSGLSITAIAEGVPDAADRIVGCHWWNPPYLMPLVEVVRGDQTSTAVLDRTEAVVESVGRDPIRVNADVPGFVWNRIQFAVLRECMHIVEEGIASIEAVDRAVRDGYALRTATVGPFETVDLSGLELFRDIAAELYPTLATDTTPSELFSEYLDDGRSGVEAGAGFYEYDVSPTEAVRRRDERIAAIRRALGATPSERAADDDRA
ncbi:MAG: 3-hydroxyacyl-CoA dehydrogenase family protein [Halobacteriales archaeon]|nr:3-hydroxyacyl-CoA dehydrogenase family protein [Halobacteriales archaeon]